MDQQANQEANKEKKRFESNMTRLTTLLGGETVFKPTKVNNAAVANLVEEMLKEEQEDVQKRFKSKARDVIKRYIDFQKFVKQQEAELNKKVNEQMRTFNNEVNELFQLIENQNNLQQSFAKTLLGDEEPSEDKQSE